MEISVYFLGETYFTKEIYMISFRRVLNFGAMLFLGVTVSGCVIRPIGLGDRGGHGRRDFNQAESSSGQSSGNQDPRVRHQPP